MVLLQKRRLIFIVSMLILSIFTFYFGRSYKQESIQTVSLPVTNKVVILDAGHGRRR